MDPAKQRNFFFVKRQNLEILVIFRSDNKFQTSFFLSVNGFSLWFTQNKYQEKSLFISYMFLLSSTQVSVVIIYKIQN